ncbi:MAG: hypothetical protein KIT84_22965 [Labilithrix sp.]|nr:hypothetical protein [Labilithrix sp.]MCW5813907.1 hypothetical protein [Labilithrix sp.]
MREAHSVDHFEWEPTAGISFPGAFGGTDFNNRGERGIERQIERNRQAGIDRPPTVETTDRFLYLNAGLWGQIGSFGLTVTADALTYDVAAVSSDQASLQVGIARFHAVGAYGFMRNQLCVGAGVRMAYMGIQEKGGGETSTVISMFGVAPQAGLIVKPEDKQFRVGLTARAPVSAASNFSIESLIREQQVDGTTIQKVGRTSFISPTKVVQPWEIEFGVAYQLGPRPLNPRWIDPHDHEFELERAITEARALRVENQRAVIAQMPSATPFDRFERARRLSEMAKEEVAIREVEDAELKDAKKKLELERQARYMNWPRERVTLLASVLMTGASEQAVALEGFIDQRRELVGQRVTMTPRFSVESEAVPNLLKTRAGLYVEPSRFRDGTSREHFTVGVDVRIFEWSVFGLFPDHQWKVSSFIDMAERYQNFGFSVGTWH